jgi:Flp pilus assembly pilin Flp
MKIDMSVILVLVAVILIGAVTINHGVSLFGGLPALAVQR